jgi:hypothetical protein
MQKLFKKCFFRLALAEHGSEETADAVRTHQLSAEQ